MAILKYALARVAVLLAVAGALYLLGARSWLMWLGALVLAAMVSYAVLPGIRDDAARTLARKDDGTTRVDHDAEEEDAMLDEETTSDEDEDATPPHAGTPNEAPVDGETFVEHAEPGGSGDGADAGADVERGGSSLENLPTAVEDAPTHHLSEEFGARRRD